MRMVKSKNFSFFLYHLIRISDLFELQTTTKNKNAGPIAFKAEEYNGSIPSLVSTTYAWTKVIYDILVVYSWTQTQWIFIFLKYWIIIASCQVASILYLDQPVGTGFSYSRNPLADIPSDTGVAKPVNEFLHKVNGKLKMRLLNHLYLLMHARLLSIFFCFVVQWLDKHPEFLSNPLYVAGNSYSGIVIPTIVQEISNGMSFFHFNPIFF